MCNSNRFSLSGYISPDGYYHCIMCDAVCNLMKDRELTVEFQIGVVCGQCNHRMGTSGCHETCAECGFPALNPVKSKLGGVSLCSDACAEMFNMVGDELSDVDSEFVFDTEEEDDDEYWSYD